NNGIWRTTNAGPASVGGNVSPVFARTLATTASTNSKLAINNVAGLVTVIAATGEATGTLHRSGDGGATWDGGGFPVNNNFCATQCFYDIGVALDPTIARIVHLGGAACPNCYLRSVDGGLTFT